jgi:hypothetical protein
LALPIMVGVGCSLESRHLTSVMFNASIQFRHIEKLAFCWSWLKKLEARLHRGSGKCHSERLHNVTAFLGATTFNIAMSAFFRGRQERTLLVRPPVSLLLGPVRRLIPSPGRSAPDHSDLQCRDFGGSCRFRASPVLPRWLRGGFFSRVSKGRESSKRPHRADLSVHIPLTGGSAGDDKKMHITDGISIGA